MAVSSILLGPLTTTFRPPPDCTTVHVEEVDIAGVTGFDGHWGYECKAGETSISPVSSCFPESFVPNFASAFDHRGDDADIVLYSPGYVCPAGWTSACTVQRHESDVPPAVSGTRGIFSGTLIMWNAIEAGQAVIGCCPTGFGCGSANPANCISLLSVGQAVTGISTVGSDCNVITVTSTAKEAFDITHISAPQINLIQETAAGDTQGDGTVGNTDSDKGGNHLSRNAKIGIGISIPLAVLTLGIAAFLVATKRQRANAQTRSDPATTETKPELDGRAVAASGVPATSQYLPELGTDRPCKFDTDNAGLTGNHFELPGSSGPPPVEMDSR